MSPERHAPHEQKNSRRTLRVVLLSGGLAVTMALTGCGGEDKGKPAAAAADGYSGEDANPGAKWQDQTQDMDSTKVEAGTPNAHARVVDTALAYAWPDGGHGSAKGAARNHYDTELYDVLHVTDEGPDNSSPWSDCGVFVAFVMHKSGVDPTYPKRETNVQLDYLEKASDPNDPNRKYDHVKIDGPAQLKPGDILIFSKTYDDKGDTNPANDDKDGHTYLFTGAPGADGKQGTGDDIKAVSASWTNHVPERSSVYLSQSGRNGTTNHFSVFRFIERA